MNTELFRTFVAAVRGADELPESVRAAADQAVGVDEGSFDHSYLEFLDQQIELAPRGPQWTARLKKLKKLYQRQSTVKKPAASKKTTVRRRTSTVWAPVSFSRSSSAYPATHMAAS